jgi:hypothetical protein
MKYHTAFMHTILENTGVPTVKSLAALPNTKTVYRFVVFYADRRARNSVATIVEERGFGIARLEVIYEGFNGYKPMIASIPSARLVLLADAFARVGFDRLPDGESPAGQLRTLWLVERAAGAFYKAVMLSPHEPVLPYSTLVNAIDGYLPEAIREMSL